jgi:hypothetical protein
MGVVVVTATERGKSVARGVRTCFVPLVTLGRVCIVVDNSAATGATAPGLERLGKHLMRYKTMYIATILVGLERVTR